MQHQLQVQQQQQQQQQRHHQQVQQQQQLQAQQQRQQPAAVSQVTLPRNPGLTIRPVQNSSAVSAQPTKQIK